MKKGKPEADFLEEKISNEINGINDIYDALGCYKDFIVTCLGRAA